MFIINRCEIDVSVVAVFEPNKQPIPYKVKGTIKGKPFKVDIDIIKHVDTRSPSQIVYHCMSIFDGYEEEYWLDYYIDSYSWQIIAI